MSASERTVFFGTSGAEALERMLSRRFAAYGGVTERSIVQLVSTATPFIALLTVMAWASDGRYWLTLLLAIPAAGLLVRRFIMQRDCGHGSFLKSRAGNDFVGRVLSPLSLALYESLEAGPRQASCFRRRGHGDVEILTVAEYQASSRRSG